VLNKEGMTGHVMPDVKGMGLKDALYLLENMNIKCVPNGRGKVKVQSISPGIALQKNETVFIQLN
jgi:cell division protein FtsI (penicillin-binding protein 3)